MTIKETYSATCPLSWQMENLRQKKPKPLLENSPLMHVSPQESVSVSLPWDETESFSVVVHMWACTCFVRPYNCSSSTSASWLTSLNHSTVTGSLQGSNPPPAPHLSPLIFSETLILCLRSSTKRLTQRIAPMHAVTLVECEEPLRRCFLITRADFSGGEMSQFCISDWVSGGRRVGKVRKRKQSQRF